MQGPCFTPSFRLLPLSTRGLLPMATPPGQQGMDTQPSPPEEEVKQESRSVNKARMRCKHGACETKSKSLSKPRRSIDEAKVNRQGKTNSDKRWQSSQDKVKQGIAKQQVKTRRATVKEGKVPLHWKVKGATPPCTWTSSNHHQLASGQGSMLGPMGMLWLHPLAP